jgi:hypothetical protein
MGIMIPDVVSTRSAAERWLFQRLRRELPDSCRVLHSLGLANHPHKIVGEADFVLVSTLGIIVLEVKGGRVACQDGMWHFTNREGVMTKKRESPWEQARTAMFAVKKFVEQQDGLKGLLFGYGVVMPDESISVSGPEIPQEVLLDRRRWHEGLDAYLEKLHEYWLKLYQEKHRYAPRLPDEKQIERIARLLRPDVRTTVTRNMELARVEEEQTRLTEEQARILARLDCNPRTVVIGAAGTGKTFLALDFARRQAAEGRRVLYLCYNRLLGRHIRAHAATYPKGLIADSIHSYFRKVISRAALEKELTASSDEELYDQVFPEVFERAALQEETEFDAYDSIILDESQDLLRIRYIDALGLVLRNGFERGDWHLFMDSNQAIYEAGFNQSLLDRLVGYGCARFQLVVNCRNTLQIAKVTTFLTGLPLPFEGAVQGEKCQIDHFKNPEAGLEKLDRCVRELLKDGVRAEDIVILSRRTLSGSGLEGFSPGGLVIRDLCADEAPVPGGHNIDFCTMHAFKGLERRVVIAWNMAEIETPELERLHYCGLSRARSLLMILLQERERGAVKRQFERNSAVVMRALTQQPVLA